MVLEIYISKTTLTENNLYNEKHMFICDILDINNRLKILDMKNYSGWFSPSHPGKSVPLQVHHGGQCFLGLRLRKIFMYDYYKI